MVFLPPLPQCRLKKPALYNWHGPAIGSKDVACFQPHRGDASRPGATPLGVGTELTPEP